MGFFGSLHWFLDLFSHFRVQYFIVLSLSAPLLLIPRNYKTASIFAAAAIINLCTILPLYLGRTQVQASPDRVLRAMLINVNIDSGKPEQVAKVIQQYNPDLLVLEEVNARWLADLRPATTGYGHSKAVPRDDNFGIAFYSRFASTRSEVRQIGPAGVPSILAEVDSGRGKVSVIATHPLPPAGSAYTRMRDAHLGELPNVIRPEKTPVLLLGDLNVTPWNVKFRRLIHESGLKDSASGFGVQATWPNFMPLLLIPLDHCLHSPAVSIVKREIGSDVGSDHYPLIVDFVIGKGAL